MHLMRLGTTLTDEQIRDLSLMSSAAWQDHPADDRKRHATLPVPERLGTTSVSEQLWYSKGTSLTSFRERPVDLPDGSRTRLIAAPD